MGLRQSLAALLGVGAASRVGASITPGGAALPPAYRAATGLSQELAAYWPGMTSGDSESLPAIRVTLDRARDLVRNDAHAGAAIERLVDMVVGDGWEVVPTPDYVALGIDRDAAYQVGRQLRSEWRRFTRDPRKLCDARRRRSFDGILRQAYRTMAISKEACAALKFRPPSAGLRYQTSVALIDPDRLSNPGNAPPSLTMRGGVEFDDEGAPVAYHVRQAHLADWWAAPLALHWLRVPRETAEGRPVFVHAFEGDREDQTRGVSPFASLVAQLRMLGQHGDVELANATVNALVAAYVESDLPAQEIAESLAAPAGDGAAMKASFTANVASYFAKHPVRLGGVRVPVLPTGTKFRLNSVPRQAGEFAKFQTTFLRKIASRLGLSYEQLSHDWSLVNYSSARAALNEVWRYTRRESAVFAEQFVQPIWLAFCDEAFAKGYVTPPRGAPYFWEAADAWTQARWIGPGRGYIDPVKEAQASAMRMDNLTATLEDECAEQGGDHIDKLDQLEREAIEMKKRGLQRRPLAPAKGPAAADDAPAVGAKDEAA